MLVSFGVLSLNLTMLPVTYPPCTHLSGWTTSVCQPQPSTSWWPFYQTAHHISDPECPSPSTSSSSPSKLGTMTNPHQLSSGLKTLLEVLKNSMSIRRSFQGCTHVTSTLGFWNHYYVSSQSTCLWLFVWNVNRLPMYTQQHPWYQIERKDQNSSKKSTDKDWFWSFVVLLKFIGLTKSLSSCTLYN